MNPDPIIEEIHAFRAELYERFRNDLEGLAAYFAQQAALSGRKLVTRPLDAGTAEGATDRSEDGRAAADAA